MEKPIIFTVDDDQGYVFSGPDLERDGSRRPRGCAVERDPYWLETSVPGIFVAGDLRHRSTKRVASAVGEGSMTLQFVHQHLRNPAPAIHALQPTKG